MKRSVFSKLRIILLVSALVLVPVFASAQTQQPASGTGASGAETQGTTGTAAGAAEAGEGASSGLSTAAIVGIAAGIVIIGAFALSSGGDGGGGTTTSGHTTAGH